MWLPRYPLGTARLLRMIELENHTTAVLLKQIRAGENAARAILIARMQPLLQRFARGRVPQLLRHEQDTADLLQLTWLRVLDHLGEIQTREAGDFFAYLRTVLLNALRDALRREQRSPLQNDEDALDPSIPAENVNVEDWLAYEQALCALESPSRNVVLMRMEFGMSFVEIARELGESADAARMRFNRALIAMAGA